MAVKFVHDFSLCASVSNSCEKFEDSDVDVIIEALELCLRDLRLRKEDWREFMEHFNTTEEVT